MRLRTYLFVLIASILFVLFWFYHPFAAPSETPNTKSDAAPATSTSETIGTSVEGREIKVYRFGTGDSNLLLIGGIHGGYEANTVALAYEMIDSFLREEILIPANLRVHIIPVLNPDGYEKKVAPPNTYSDAQMRFNANLVDLNRNFDCRWQPESSWRGEVVNAGENAFSEPESAALRDYIHTTAPSAVVFWHSQGNAVYGAECGGGVLENTITLLQAYAAASGYEAYETFTAYPVTGDAESWLATLGIPAITVELGSRTDIEWTKNEAGVEEILRLYAE